LLIKYIPLTRKVSIFWIILHLLCMILTFIPISRLCRHRRNIPLLFLILQFPQIFYYLLAIPQINLGSILLLPSVRIHPLITTIIHRQTSLLLPYRRQILPIIIRKLWSQLLIPIISIIVLLLNHRIHHLLPRTPIITHLLVQQFTIMLLLALPFHSHQPLLCHRIHKIK
jgi:hypothetical protein